MTREELAEKALEQFEKIVKNKDDTEQACDEIEKILKSLSGTGGDDKIEEFIKQWSELVKNIRKAIKTVEKDIS